MTMLCRGSSKEQRQFSGGKETQQVHVTPLRPITLICDETAAHHQIAVNIVVAYQSHARSFSPPGQEWQGHLPDRLHHQLGAGMYSPKVRHFYQGSLAI